MRGAFFKFMHHQFNDMKSSFAPMRPRARLLDNRLGPPRKTGRTASNQLPLCVHNVVILWMSCGQHVEEVFLSGSTELKVASLVSKLLIVHLFSIFAVKRSVKMNFKGLKCFVRCIELESYK